MLRQFIRSTIRDWAVCRIGALCPSSSPATTTLITPEAWISSATTYAANGVRKLSPLSRPVSVTCLRTNPITRKNASPTTIPPPAATRKSPCQCLPRHRCHDRRAQGDQCSRVVEQRLPLEDRHDAARKADAPTDRRRGHSVGRRHDGTDREGRGPPEVGQDCVDQDGYADRREGHETDRQQQDRPPVGVEVDQARLQCCGVQQRRQQAEEHHLRLEVHVRDERQVRADDPHHDQDEWGGEVESRAETGDRDDHGDDPDECQDDMHALIIANADLGIPSDRSDRPGFSWPNLGSARPGCAGCRAGPRPR